MRNILDMKTLTINGQKFFVVDEAAREKIEDHKCIVPMKGIELDSLANAYELVVGTYYLTTTYFDGVSVWAPAGTLFLATDIGTLEEQVSLNDVIVTIDASTRLASHTPAEIFEAVWQGKTVVLKEGDGENVWIYHLAYAIEGEAVFAHITADPTLCVHHILEDRSTVYEEHSLATSNDLYNLAPCIVTIDVSTGVASHTPYEIYNCIQQNCTIVLYEEDADGGVASYHLAYCNSTVAVFERITDDSAMQSIIINADGSTQFANEVLATMTYVNSDEYKAEITQAVIKALPVYNGEVI